MLKAPLVLILSFVVFVAIGVPEVALAVSAVVATVEAARFAVAGLISAAGLLHSPRWGIYPLLTILAALTGGGFSVRQLYLQNLPPDQVPSCGPDMTYMLENFPLADVLAAMTRGTATLTRREILRALRHGPPRRPSS